jgi:hypothetical protein
MKQKKRFVARWNCLPGAYHDCDDPNSAIMFAQLQNSYLPLESEWFVIDNKTNEVIAHK